MQINILLNMSGVFLKRGAFNFAWPCPNDLLPLTTNSKTKLKCVRYQTKNVTDDGMWHLYIRPGTLPPCLHPVLAWSMLFLRPNVCVGGWVVCVCVCVCVGGTPRSTQVT